MPSRKIAILVLAGSTKWTRIQTRLDQIAAAIDGLSLGEYQELEIPHQG